MPNTLRNISDTAQGEFRVPFTNPFFMRKVGEKMAWDGSLEEEESREYVQKWKSTDRLSFQFSWTGIRVDEPSPVMYVQIVVNGEVKFNRAYTLELDGIEQREGTMYGDYMVNRAGGKGKMNGVYCFSQILGEIEEGGSRIVSNGDCFNVRCVDMLGGVWESSEMICTEETDGTKLFHYTNTCSMEQEQQDTLWGYMPFGYEIRLDASFTDLTPKIESEVFEGLGGDYNLMSATATERVKLVIGSPSVWMPRKYLRIMNAMMACDDKQVEGVGFELPEGGTIDVERVQGYANDMYSCEIARKENRRSYRSKGKASDFEAFCDLDFTRKEPVSAEGFIEVFSNENWYIDEQTLPDTISLGAFAGTKGQSVIRIEAQRNYTDEDITETISILDLKTREKIGELVIVRKAEKKRGLNYMIIGDTFKIS